MDIEKLIKMIKGRPGMFVGNNLIGNCETGLAFDVQRRETPDFVGDEQEKVDGDTGKVGMEGKQTEKRAHE